jgi:predicted kinase
MLLSAMEKFTVSDGRPTLFLMCGLPGAGKTTVAKRLATEFSAIRLSPDDWMAVLGIDLFDGEMRSRVEILEWALAQELLEAGQSVILESGFWLRLDRDEKRLKGRRLGARVELHYLNPSLDELHQRLAKRHTRHPKEEVRITRGQLDQWAASFEPPDAAELALFDSFAES